MLWWLLFWPARAFLWLLDRIYKLRMKKADYPYPYDNKTGQIKLPQEIEREIRQLVQSGQKIEAMKRVLDLTGAGLRYSKVYVDQFQK
jgi:hypothetical protein